MGGGMRGILNGRDGEEGRVGGIGVKLVVGREEYSALAFEADGTACRLPRSRTD